MEKIAFCVAIILGVLTARTTLVGSRGGIVTTSMQRMLLSVTATFLTFSLFVWGFASLRWYWPVGAFLVATIASSLAVTLETWPHLFRIEPVFDAVTVAIALYLWIALWPF